MFWLSRRRQRSFLLLILLLAGLSGAAAWAQAPHNLILFVPDGLRPGSISPAATPAFAQVRDQGVHFANSHFVFPTLTVVNSAAIGTGHFPGDPGNFCNNIYARFPLTSANRNLT